MVDQVGEDRWECLWGIPLRNFPDRGSQFHQLKKETPGFDETTGGF